MQIVKLKDIPALTGLRFFAAFFVCAAHLAPKLVDASSQWAIVSLLSAEGMTLFFVLSGFVIHYNYSKLIQENWKVGAYHFFIARFARLVPLYMVCLLLDILLTFHRSIPHSIPHFFSAMPYYLTLTQSWFYVLMGENELIYQFGKMMQVSWSISTEWFFYLCYPLVCFALIKLGSVRAKMMALTCIAFLAISGIAFCAYEAAAINQIGVKVFGVFADSSTHNQDSFFRWLIYFSPYFRISEFLIGCITAAIYMQLSPTIFSKVENQLGIVFTFAALMSVALSHYLIWSYSYTHMGWISTLHLCFGFAPSAGAVIFCCARYDNAITRIFSNPVLVLGGEISYSMYLLHTLVIEYAIFHFIPPESIHQLVGMKFILIFSAICSISYITYNLIEIPARRFIRQKLMRSPAQKTTTANANEASYA
jgi:peptidoglycan/LPS O-acetylase OafA/YrhL